MTLPKSGKGQSDRSVGFRAHSMTINLCDDIFTRYYFHKVRKRKSERFQETAKSLGYDCLKPEQERVLSEFMSGKDVLVALPTGYGKSLCYSLTSQPLHRERKARLAGETIFATLHYPPLSI